MRCRCQSTRQFAWTDHKLNEHERFRSCTSYTHREYVWVPVCNTRSICHTIWIFCAAAPGDSTSHMCAWLLYIIKPQQQRKTEHHHAQRRTECKKKKGIKTKLIFCRSPASIRQRQTLSARSIASSFARSYRAHGPPSVPIYISFSFSIFIMTFNIQILYYFFFSSFSFVVCAVVVRSFLVPLLLPAAAWLCIHFVCNSDGKIHAIVTHGHDKPSSRVPNTLTEADVQPQLYGRWCSELGQRCPPVSSLCEYNTIITSLYDFVATRHVLLLAEVCMNEVCVVCVWSMHAHHVCALKFNSEIITLNHPCIHHTAYSFNCTLFFLSFLFNECSSPMWLLR